MLATRLLRGYAGGPAQQTIALTAAGEGGWNQQSDFKGAYYNGKTYFGWVASDGDVKIATYTHATGVVSSAYTLHAALAADVHVSPSIWLMSDTHKIVVAYTKHDEAVFYLRRSTNAEEITAWEAEQELDATLGGNTYTYPEMFEFNGVLTIFYRDQASATSHLTYTYSSDGGATWQAQTQLAERVGYDCYWKVATNGSRQEIALIDGHPVTDAPTKLYHAYSDTSAWYTSAGATISARPFTPSDMTQVDDGSSGSCWPMSIAPGANPRILYWRGTYGAGNMDIVHARWTGAAWDKHVVAGEGKDGTVIYAPGGAVFDASDPDVVYASRWDGDEWEMFRYATADSGATWTGRQLTNGSADPAFWPAPVKDHGSPLRVIWLRGTISADDTYSAAVEGW